MGVDGWVSIGDVHRCQREGVNGGKRCTCVKVSIGHMGVASHTAIWFSRNEVRRLLSPMNTWMKSAVFAYTRVRPERGGDMTSSLRRGAMTSANNGGQMIGGGGASCDQR